MAIDWNEIQKALFPVKDYEDLSRRWKEAFAYPCVVEAYNISMPAMADYTRHLLGEDTRKRYEDYCGLLVEIFDKFNNAEVRDILDLTSRVDSRQRFEAFASQSGIPPKEIVTTLTYLIYWFIPGNKYLSSLVRNDNPILEAMKTLRGQGIRTNLDALQRGKTKKERETIARESGLPETVVTEIVNRADFSRMPWASKATISNIIGAGYPSLDHLAGADPQQLYDDFFRYGQAIGKNLKFGNEIESSYRIAKILPRILTR